MERDGAGFFLVAAASAVGIILQSSMTVICNAKFVPVLREFVPFVNRPPPPSVLSLFPTHCLAVKPCLGLPLAEKNTICPTSSSMLISFRSCVLPRNFFRFCASALPIWLLDVMAIARKSFCRIYRGQLYTLRCITFIL